MNDEELLALIIKETEKMLEMLFEIRKKGYITKEYFNDFISAFPGHNVKIEK